MVRFYLILLAFSLLIFSCEEVINIDLDYVSPTIASEATVYTDSVCMVHLTMTTSYFSPELPDPVKDAVVKISDGVRTEELSYTGNGYYKGKTITGEEKQNYQFEILHDGNSYFSTSTMPVRTVIESTSYSKSNSQSILNPYGETVITINCRFHDDPGTNNYYMICYMADGKMVEDRYFMLTEKGANGGSFDNTDNIISFSESIFYDGNEIILQLYSIDEAVYNYFRQLDDVLFWKRRVLPPNPYNPESNISNGALGFFAACTCDTRNILIE